VLAGVGEVDSLSIIGAASVPCFVDKCSKEASGFKVTVVAAERHLDCNVCGSGTNIYRYGYLSRSKANSASHFSRIQH
jgi:hypothetical protein